MVVAAIGLGEVLWSLLAVFFMVMYFMILFNVIVDLFRDHELNGASKALWFIGLLVVPLISMLLYVVIRGDGMAHRSTISSRAAQQQFDTYIREVAGSTPTDQIAQAKSLLDSGAITPDEFELLKAKALA